jgi:hypothetical protein
MTIKMYAFTMLVAHVGSMVFIFLVLRRQWALMKQPIPPAVRRFRVVLFMLSMAIFVGNIVPLAIDLATLFVETSRPPVVKPLSLAYAYSNALILLVSSYLIWTLYRLAADTKSVTDFEKKALDKRVKARKG